MLQVYVPAVSNESGGSGSDGGMARASGNGTWRAGASGRSAPHVGAGG
jgi:hypothetical protein